MAPLDHSPHDSLRRTPLAPFGLLIEPANEQAPLTSVSPTTLAELTTKARLVVLRGFPLLEASDLAAYCSTWGKNLT